MRKVPIPNFTVHQHCGAATYLFYEEGHFIPITNFFDVEGFLEFLEKITPEINGKISKVRALSEVMRQVPKYIDEKKGFKSVNVVRMILDVLKTGDMKILHVFTEMLCLLE